MNVQEYINIISKRFQSGISREHSYRGDLEALIRNISSNIEITNEPANVTDCGNPDYVITKGKIPVGYIEAKDIGKDLNSTSYKEQFDRYKKALDNLIITDYVWFQFYQNGELLYELRIGEIENNKIKPIPSNFSEFENLIKDFSSYLGQTIKSSKKLAEMMAGKARLLQNILKQAIVSDEKTQENTSLKGQYDTFKEILIHDLKPKDFADIYAQTLAYGMFAARLHDTSLENFSRQEAAELIPKTNPFLRKLFGYIAGPDIDERIITIVNNLADVFRATNVDQLLKNFGKSTQTNDPIIHFYETFLTEYDSKLRKAKGVWYTPEPVVKFIVRAVDDILKTEFDLPQGLADISKTKIKVNTDITDNRSLTGYKQVEKEVHKVQILDPATGTGTFLAEVVKYIHSKNFSAMQGAWSGYVEEHLIPRLNGFELLMASYAMAHLKLDMLLAETGYKSIKNNRFNVYLTNSLEEYHKDTGTLFSNWLSSEANEANHIKRDTPVMCIIGNPPYSGESANKGKWIMGLMEDYKREPGGEEKLKERNPKWINDDYVKFIRYSQHYIEKNGSGVLAFITPHGFLDNPTFRGMRWNLLKTYDKIYTVDLHGNSKKKEVCPDGSKDQNVFDIMQGVAITIFAKTAKKKTNDLAKVFHYDLYGKRDFKYNFLNENNIKTIPFKELPNIEPNYFMVEKNYKLLNTYNDCIELNSLFNMSSVGVLTHRDVFSINEKKEVLINNINRLYDDKNNLLDEYNLKEKGNFKVDNIVTENAEKYIEDILPINYRIFDSRYIIYNKKFVERPRSILKNMLSSNLSIIIQSQTYSLPFNHVFISNILSDLNFISNLGGGTVCPLYINSDGQQTIESSQARTPNLNKEIVAKIEEKLGLIFTNEKEDNINTFAPIDILDYIYAVLHSPFYREKYNEFLKIDFPRVPYPKNQSTFWDLVRFGGEIRQIHLLESPKVEDYITSFPKDGDYTITTKIEKKDWELFDEENRLGRIWINDKQYFDNIPLTTWEFYIGGYQPAQKWLKDRRQRELKFEDILHYQKIIVALSETDRIMKEINKIEVE